MTGSKNLLCVDYKYTQCLFGFQLDGQVHGYNRNQLRTYAKSYTSDRVNDDGGGDDAPYEMCVHYIHNTSKLEIPSLNMNGCVWVCMCGWVVGGGRIMQVCVCVRVVRCGMCLHVRGISWLPGGVRVGKL